MRGAWIEIKLMPYIVGVSKSHPVRGAWIEMTRWSGLKSIGKSHPVRGAWIEILVPLSYQKTRPGRTP